VDNNADTSLVWTHDCMQTSALLGTTESASCSGSPSNLLLYADTTSHDNNGNFTDFEQGGYTVSGATFDF
jgi:hypothetical protein